MKKFKMDLYLLLFLGGILTLVATYFISKRDQKVAEKNSALQQQIQAELLAAQSKLLKNQEETIKQLRRSMYPIQGIGVNFSVLIDLNIPELKAVKSLIQNNISEISKLDNSHSRRYVKQGYHVKDKDTYNISEEEIFKNNDAIQRLLLPKFRIDINSKRLEYFNLPYWFDIYAKNLHYDLTLESDSIRNKNYSIIYDQTKDVIRIYSDVTYPVLEENANQITSIIDLKKADFYFQFLPFLHNSPAPTTTFVERDYISPWKIEVLKLVLPKYQTTIELKQENIYSTGLEQKLYKFNLDSRTLDYYYN